MKSFYHEVISELLEQQIVNCDMKILVLCGGEIDRKTLLDCGLKNVVISNLDSRMDPKGFEPFDWSYQDAEKISFDDNSFDFVITHRGLHHCYSPHQGLLEMYRVANIGILFFEPYDNWVTRIGVKLGFGQEYEHAAVYYNDYEFGGVRNTHIPNYVYRWTEREIIKTINSFNSLANSHFRFIYRMLVPWAQLKGRKNRFYYFLMMLGVAPLKIFFWLFPKQSNFFAALVLKPQLPADLHCWLKWENQSVVLNKSWLNNRYGPLSKDDLSS